MPAERFFQRWSRLKTAPAAPLAATEPLKRASPVRSEPAPSIPSELAPSVPSAAAPQAAHGAGLADKDSPAAPQPTLEDVAQLHAGSDYSVFVARGIDKSVQRSALKKLFSDPHFNTGDGLDLYMGDYNKPDPIPAAMMSALRHSRSFFAAAYPEKHENEDEPSSTGLDIAAAGSPPAPADIEAPMAGTTGAVCAASEYQA